jgi:hypothetical protein
MNYYNPKDFNWRDKIRYFIECAGMPVTHELHKKQVGEMCCLE